MKTNVPKESAAESQVADVRSKTEANSAQRSIADKRATAAKQSSLQAAMNTDSSTAKAHSGLVQKETDSVSSEVIQAKGFKSVNGAEPVLDDSATGQFAAAGRDVWDLVFTDDRIDEEGGVDGLFTEGDAKMDAEATTKYEDPELTKGAFAVVNATGNLPTTITRWEKQQVDDGTLLMTNEQYEENSAAIKQTIARILLGKEEFDGSEKPELIDLEILDEEEERDEWIRENEGIVEVLAEFLQEKIDRYDQKIPDDVFGICDTAFEKYSRDIMGGLQELLTLENANPDSYVSNETELGMNEVIAHEFGHINAALDVSEESIEEHRSRQSPDFATVKEIVLMLNEMTNPETGDAPDRALVTNLRFSLATTVSNYYKIDPGTVHEDAAASFKALRDALPTLANILVSFEEYFNIESIDNNPEIVAEGGEKKRTSHGSEIATGYKLDVPFDDERIAPKLGSLEPDAMSQAVWVGKLKTLLERYIEVYGEHFPD